MELPKSTVIIYKESLFQSILMDIVTFVMLSGLFAVNYYYLGNSWFGASILFIMVVIQLSALKPNYRFYSYDKAIQFLQDQKKNK